MINFAFKIDMVVLMQPGFVSLLSSVTLVETNLRFTDQHPKDTGVFIW